MFLSNLFIFSNKIENSKTLEMLILDILYETFPVCQKLRFYFVDFQNGVRFKYSKKKLIYENVQRQNILLV